MYPQAIRVRRSLPSQDPQPHLRFCRRNPQDDRGQPHYRFGRIGEAYSGETHRRFDWVVTIPLYSNALGKQALQVSHQRSSRG